MARQTTSRAIRDDGFTNYGYGLSVLLHLIIVGLAYSNIPFFHRDPPEEAPIIVDVVEIADVTSAAPKPQPELAPEPTPPKPEPVKPEPQDAPPPSEAAMPPPPKPEPEKPKEPEKKPEPAPKPPPPKPTPPQPKTKEQDMAALQKLLKDMQKSAPKAASPTTESKAQANNNVAPNISDRASMTELDAIRRHIEACWRIDPGKEGIENLSVDIKVFINPDGSVKEAQFADITKYLAGDRTYQSFANTARNAVLGCGNIPISPERYNTFKEMTMTFSPQGRIN